MQPFLNPECNDTFRTRNSILIPCVMGEDRQGRFGWDYSGCLLWDTCLERWPVTDQALCRVGSSLTLTGPCPHRELQPTWYLLEGKQAGHKKISRRLLEDFIDNFLTQVRKKPKEKYFAGPCTHKQEDAYWAHKGGKVAVAAATVRWGS